MIKQFLQDLNPLTKVIMLVALTVIIFLTKSIFTLLGLFIYIIILMLTGQIGLGTMRWLLLPSLISIPLTLAIFIGSYWLTFHSFSLGIERGLEEGMLFFIRIFLLLIANILFIRTTDIRQFAQTLSALRIPRVITVLITTVFRFFPLMLQEGQRIIEVQRTRGIKPTHLLRPHHFLPVVIPLLLNNMQRSHEMALSMKLRGINLRTPVDSIDFNLQDFLVLGTHGCLLFALL